MLKVGDVVQVKQFELRGVIAQEKLTLARVTQVRDESFLVKSLRGPLDNDGHTEMWLEKHGNGRTWE